MLPFFYTKNFLITQGDRGDSRGDSWGYTPVSFWVRYCVGTMQVGWMQVGKLGTN